MSDILSGPNSFHLNHGAESAETHVGRMERALVASHDPEEIVSLLKFLQGVSPPVRLTSLSASVSGVSCPIGIPLPGCCFSLLLAQNLSVFGLTVDCP